MAPVFLSLALLATMLLRLSDLLSDTRQTSGNLGPKEETGLYAVAGLGLANSLPLPLTVLPRQASLTWILHKFNLHSVRQQLSIK